MGRLPLLSPLRRLGQNPARILAPYVRHGMTVLEVGPAMGYFSLPLARMVGPEGRVVCVDVQRRMLDRLERRARRAGLADRIETVHAAEDSLRIGAWDGRVDFTLGFAVEGPVTIARSRSVVLRRSPSAAA